MDPTAPAIIAAVIQAFGAIAAAIIGRVNGNGDTPRKKWLSVLSFLLIAGAVIALIVAAYQFFAVTDVRITSPPNGAAVDASPMIEGHARNVPKDQNIWLVVYSAIGQGYFPQDGPVPTPANGDWRSQVFLGGPGDSGKNLAFDIYAVLADAAASAQFAAYVKRTKQEMFQHKKPPVAFGGSLPPGATPYSHITVTRR